MSTEASWLIRDGWAEGERERERERDRDRDREREREHILMCYHLDYCLKSFIVA